MALMGGFLVKEGDAWLSSLAPLRKPSTFVFFSNFYPQPENIYVKAHQRVSIAHLPATKPFPGPLHGTDTLPLIGSDIHTYLQIKHKLTVCKGKVDRNLRCDEPKR